MPAYGVQSAALTMRRVPTFLGGRSRSLVVLMANFTGKLAELKMYLI